MSTDHDQHPFRLSTADEAALEALVNASWDPNALPDNLRPRALRLLALLATLNADVPHHQTDLAALTMSFIDNATSPAELSGDDAEALDAYVAAGYRTSRVASSLRARAAKIEQMVTLVSATTVPGEIVAGLADRTMNTIENSPARRVAAEAVAGRIGPGRFRWADMVGVAAVLTIGASVVWPVASSIGAYRTKQNCEANFGAIAGAFGQYASDFRDQLPVAASFAGPVWWDVGVPERSNSANLFVLPARGYAPLQDFACAGNACACRHSMTPDARDWTCPDEISYSYHVMAGKQTPLWRLHTDTVILADRSPVIVRAMRGERICDSENSQNHQGRGQWALRVDGSVCWLNSPHVGADNIWLPRIVEQAVAIAKGEAARRGAPVQLDVAIHGSEVPASPDDSFLGP